MFADSLGYFDFSTQAVVPTWNKIGPLFTLLFGHTFQICPRIDDLPWSSNEITFKNECENNIRQ